MKTATWILLGVMALAITMYEVDAQTNKATKAGSAEAAARIRAYQDNLNKTEPAKKVTTVNDVLVYLVGEVKTLKAEVAELRKEVATMKRK